MSWIENRFEEGLIITSVDWALNWANKSSIWPMTFGLACCAIEMMAFGASRFDIDRFGAGAFRATPRQADLMIVAGTVTYKMASRVKRLYNQMPEPKYVMAMGACTVGGGPYFKHGYHVVKGVDMVVPVDVYVPGDACCILHLINSTGVRTKETQKPEKPPAAQSLVVGPRRR